MKKRILSILLSACMMMTMVPVAFAAVTPTATLPEADSKGVITLEADASVYSTTWSLTDDTTIDLGGKTLNITGGTTINIPDGKTLTLKNGNIVANRYAKGRGVLAPNANASLIMDEVNMTTTGSAILPAGNAAAVKVAGSTITSTGYYVISTNAKKVNDAYEYGSNFQINLSDSTFTVSNGEKDNCAVLINVPGTLTMNNCIVSGQRQGVIVRAGTANITNCDIKTTGEYTNPNEYRSGAWGSGNEVPAAALTVGNYVNGDANSYEANAVVTLTDTKITGTESFPGIYTDANTKYTSSLEISGDKTKVTGAVLTGQQTTGNTINVAITGGTFDVLEGNNISSFIQPGMSLDNNGKVVINENTAVAKIGSVGYDSLPAAIEAAEAGDTVELLKSITVTVPQGTTADNTRGALTIDKGITIKGGEGITLTADETSFTVNDDGKGQFSVFNIIRGNVTIEDLTIDGNRKARHGINIFRALEDPRVTVTLNNVTSKNSTCYGVVTQGADTTAENLNTSNNGWGGVNVDTRSSAAGGSFIMKSGTLTETGSVVVENSGGKDTGAQVTIEGGNFQRVGIVEGATNASLVITGGTFSTDVSKYCPSDYTCTQEESNYVVKKATGLSTSVDTPTGSNKVSVTVTGVVPTTTEDVSGDEGLDTSTPTEATIKATTAGGDASPKDATITIPASTAATMTSNTGYELTVEADAATVKLNKDAMKAVQSAAAGTEDDGKDISMEIKKTTVSGNGEDSPSTVYSVTVKAGDDEILSENVAPANTAITITVPAPADHSGTVYVWLMTKDSSDAWKKVSEVKGATLSDGKVIFTTKHLSDYAVFSNEQESDYEVSYTNSSNGITYGTFSDAITTVENNGAITLLKDVTLTNPVITLSKTVTIKNTEGENHKINVSMDTDGAAQIKTAFTLTKSNGNVGKLTLDGVTMNVKTADNTQTSDSARNAAFSLTNGTELNLTNGAQLNLDKLQTGMYMPGTVPVDAKVTVSGAGTKLTATDINGNFSNGGQFEVKDGAELSIVKCTSHGLSANKVNVENAKVTVKNTGLCGIITVDSNAEVTLGEGAEVVVENCATGSDSQNRAAVELSKSGTAKLTMDKNSSLAVSGTGDRSNKVALADNSGSTLNGNISGAVQQGSNAAVTYHQITFHVTPETATVVVKDSTGAVQNNVNNTYALEAGNYTYQVSANGYYTRTGSFTVDKSDTITVTLSQISTGGGGAPTYAVSVDSARNGSVSVSPKNASKGSTVTITVAPDKGYELDTLTVTDKDGKAVSVTKKNGTQYTFTMPASKVDVKATFKAVELKPTQTFIDVPINAYYADAVAWAVENGVTNGTGANTFSPDLACTRGQMVTFLWRAAGSPKASGTNPFTDLQPGSYYYDAVLWAVSQGITNGTSATTFSPEATVTRGQVVTFLYRYEKSPAVSGSNPFADVAADAYYAKAVQWAVREGITNGTGNNTFSPETDCTRGQIVTFLYRDMAD